MRTQSGLQKELLLKAAKSYSNQIVGTEAEEYLFSRGLGKRDIEHYRFGVVNSPSVGHEHYQGMISIPYVRWHPKHKYSVVSIRFRNLGEGAKYLTLAGDRPRLFNTVQLHKPVPVVGIAEGEFDSVIATKLGLPTVGVPGATSFQPEWGCLFAGYRRVVLLGDGDDAGQNFNDHLARLLPNAVPVKLPDGHDINSFCLDYGEEETKQFLENATTW